MKAPKPIQTHVGQFSDRVITLSVEETPNSVIFTLQLTKAEPWPTMAEFVRFKQWIWEIIYPYDADPRPTVFHNPMAQEMAVIIAPPNGPGLTEPPF